MSYLIAIFVIGLATGLGWVVLRPVSASAEAPQTPRLVYTMAAEKPEVEREALSKKLEELSNQLAPPDLKPGAMCYDQAAPPERAEYVCPKCKEKTLYALAQDGGTIPPEDSVELSRIAADLNYQLSSCRRLVKEIKGLNVELDESQFCRKCHPEVKNPQLGLIVRYSGQKTPHRVWGVTSGDLRLLVEFMAGKTKHVGERDSETPLKNHLKRLEELLGVKPGEVPTKK